MAKVSHKFINYTKIILYLKPLSVSKVQFFAIHLQHQLTYLRANVNVRQDRMFCMIFLCLINRNVFCNIYFTFILRAVTSTLDIWKNSVKTHCWNVVCVSWFELHFSKFCLQPIIQSRVAKSFIWERSGQAARRAAQQCKFEELKRSEALIRKCTCFLIHFLATFVS